MLRIIQNSSAARAKSYYSTADYYTEGQELVGRWRGLGAERLGLAGVIDRSDWDALCDNLRPDTGEALTVRRKSERRVGWDFNFHCPKSVSLLYGLTRDERILEGFRESVDATMEDIEAEAKARVRRGGRNEDRTTGNLTWGEFIHFTARPENGVPDPHLHAHCFVLNGTFDPEEKRWKAVQIGEIKRDAPYFEAVFHARLARRLEELGLATQRTAKGWEVRGIEAETLAKFSRRTARIEKLARERGITDPKAKAELGALTRSGKVPAMSLPELEAAWRARLTEGERASLDAAAGRLGQTPSPQSVPAAEQAVARALEHCFERASVVPERTLLAEALRQGVGATSRETIERLVGQEPLVRATRDGRTLVTTRLVLEEESRMLGFARAGRGACRPINPNRQKCNRAWLNAQQQAAVRHVLESRDRVVLVRGAAGAGKTTMMQEAREAIEESGLRVFAFAPSSAASRGVLRSEGFESAETVARLLADPSLQAEAKGAVLWIDEAGLLGTKTIRELFDLVGRLGARVVLSGDRRQHGSVERGAALRLLEDEAGLAPAEIQEIQRQKHHYKEAVKELSEGRIEAGFHRLDRLGWIREVPDEDRHRVLAAAYIDSVREGKTALVISPTHAEGERIAQEIRNELRARRLLGDERQEVLELVPANLTLGQRRDKACYHPDDLLVFHQNAAKGIRKGQRFLVGQTPVPLDQAERFTVFRRSSIELSPGDRIRVTKNGSTLDGAHRLNNGDLFTVKGFTRRGDIEFENGWAVSKDFGHLTQGHVTTSHASQGKTVDRVFIGQSSDSFPASSREQFYVSASRGREQVVVFTDSKTELLEAVSRSDERLSATELVAQRDSTHRRIRERTNAPAHDIPTVKAPQREAIEYDR